MYGNYTKFQFVCINANWFFFFDQAYSSIFASLMGFSHYKIIMSMKPKTATMWHSSEIVSPTPLSTDF